MKPDELRIQLSCPHCAEKFAANREIVGGVVACPACGELFGAPKNDRFLKPGERPAPPPPELQGWPRQRRGLQYAAAAIAVHAAYLALQVWACDAHAGCFVSLEKAILVRLFPGHAMIYDLSREIFASNKLGVYLSVLLSVPLSMLYPRIAVRIWRLAVEKGCFSSIPRFLVLVLLLILLAAILIGTLC